MTILAIPAGIASDSFRRTSFRGSGGRRAQAGRGRSGGETRSNVVRAPRRCAPDGSSRCRCDHPIRNISSEYLKWIKTNYAPVYLSLAATDAQGTVVASTEPSLVGRDYSRSASFIAARATRRLDIADVAGLEMEESDVDTIAFTAPILDAQGTFLGVVTSRVGVPFFAEVTTRTIRSLEARPEMGGRAEYEMLTKQGKVFADSDLSYKKGDHHSQRTRIVFSADERGRCTVGLSKKSICADMSRW